MQELEKSTCFSENCSKNCIYAENKCAYRKIISALEEIQQYRETGLTPELIQAMKGYNNDLIEQLAEYQEIGTVEACREAVEKQKAKRIEYETNAVFSNGFSHYRIGKCPICDNRYNSNDEIAYCSKCGQALMNENLEGMEDE